MLTPPMSASGTWPQAAARRDSAGRGGALPARTPLALSHPSQPLPQPSPGPEGPRTPGAGHSEGLRTPSCEGGPAGTLAAVAGLELHGVPTCRAPVASSPPPTLTHPVRGGTSTLPQLRAPQPPCQQPGGSAPSPPRSPRRSPRVHAAGSPRSAASPGLPGWLGGSCAGSAPRGLSQGVSTPGRRGRLRPTAGGGQPLSRSRSQSQSRPSGRGQPAPPRGGRRARRDARGSPAAGAPPRAPGRGPRGAGGGVPGQPPGPPRPPPPRSPVGHSP